jgi:rubrerythrin
MKNFSLLEAVEVSINMEEEGIRFYTLALERMGEGEAGRLFALLRDKEYDHINTFRRIHTNLSAKGGSTDADLYLTDPEVSAFFRAMAESAVFPVKGAAEKVLATLRTEEEILQLGMRVEKDSIAFYHELKTHSPYPEAAEALDLIIAEERRHFRALFDLWKRRTCPS